MPTSSNYGWKKFIEIKGEHNHDIFTRKSDAPLVFKNIKDLSKSNTQIVAVARAIETLTYNLATQLAVPTKENLVRTAVNMRK